MFRLVSIPLFAAVCLVFFSIANAPCIAAPRSGPARKYFYHFENEKFDTSLVDLAVDDSGRGTIRFRSKDADGVVENPVALRPETVASLRQLYTELAYLAGGERYQSKYDYPHLGTVTIGIADSDGERKTVFNFTQHPVMSKLLDLFRNIATQELSYFRFELALRYYPLDAPKQLSALESNLKTRRIPEPDRFVPVLKEILNSEQMLLIAKRQAEKLLKEIEKPASKP